MKGGAAAYRFRGMPLRIMIAEPTNSVKIISRATASRGQALLFFCPQMPCIAFYPLDMIYTMNRRNSQEGALTLERTGVLIECVSDGRIFRFFRPYKR